MCIKFAEMERRLGEIDRARAIYGHASQFCDPRVDAAFWKKWEQFEVQHGNEDTFKEMLRIKRSVQAQFKFVSPISERAHRETMKANTPSQYRRQLHRLAGHRPPTSAGRHQRRRRRRERFRRRPRQGGRHGGSGKTSKSPGRFRRRFCRSRRRQQAQQSPGVRGRQRQRRQERRRDRSRR